MDKQLKHMVTHFLSFIFCNQYKSWVVKAKVNQQEEYIIIQKCCKGDHAAFSDLVTAYQDMAITLAYNIVTNNADAEDVAQDAFIKAFTSIKSFKGSARFSTWLYRIVVNTALNKQKRSKLLYVEHPEELHDEAVEDSFTGIRYHEQKKYIRQALLSLSEAERICITLYYINELNIAEIGEITGLTVSNIKLLLYRGRKHLYSELDRVLKLELKDIL